MELKYLHVNEKKYSDTLLISQKQVHTLQQLLMEVLENEVLIINTNLGLEFYYESEKDNTNLIINTLAIVIKETFKNDVCVDFLCFQNEQEIR